MQKYLTAFAILLSLVVFNGCQPKDVVNVPKEAERWRKSKCGAIVSGCVLACTSFDFAEAWVVLCLFWVCK